MYRVYCEEQLNLRTKRPHRSRSAANRLDRMEPGQLNQVWSMDFLLDGLFDGSRFRVLAVVDNWSKKCLCLLVGKSLKGADVRDALDRIALAEQAVPLRLQCDNGSEVESFNGKFRDECLSTNWFLSLTHAQELIDQWRWDYNHIRPHSSLGDLPPEIFINTQPLISENSILE